MSFSSIWRPASIYTILAMCFLFAFPVYEMIKFVGRIPSVLFLEQRYGMIDISCK